MQQNFHWGKYNLFSTVSINYTTILLLITDTMYSAIPLFGNCYGHQYFISFSMSKHYKNPTKRVVIGQS